MIKKRRLISIVYYLFVLAFSITTKIATAQTIKGKWYGTGTVDVASNSTNTYLCEMIVDQKGNVITGEFNYYFRNGYFSNKIKGTYNPEKRLVQFNFIPIIFYKTVNAAFGVDCSMKASLTLKVSKVNTTLTGKFMADELHAYTCAPIAIKLNKQFKEIPKDSLKFITTIVEKDSVEVPTVYQPSIREDETNNAFNKRTKQFFKELIISDENAIIEIYDNGVFDNDSISLFYNKKLIIHQQELNTKTPIVLSLIVDKDVSKNELSMVAENLGSIPPNSAVMIIKDSKHRYEVNVSSTLEKSGTIRLKRTQ